MGDSLYSIECSCFSKFVLIQHILSTQVSDTGPMVLWYLFSIVFHCSVVVLNSFLYISVTFKKKVVGSQATFIGVIPNLQRFYKDWLKRG